MWKCGKLDFSTVFVAQTVDLAVNSIQNHQLGDTACS
jgi:hypothetical protein